MAWIIKNFYSFIPFNFRKILRPKVYIFVCLRVFTRESETINTYFLSQFTKIWGNKEKNPENSDLSSKYKDQLQKNISLKNYFVQLKIVPISILQVTCTIWIYFNLLWFNWYWFWHSWMFYKSETFYQLRSRKWHMLPRGGVHSV